MHVEKIVARITRSVTAYRAALEPLSDADVARSPPGGGWCVGQVCDHVASVSDLMLENARRCAEGDGDEHAFSLLPAILCAVGTFPPVRIKIPELPARLAHLAQPDVLTRDHALAAIARVADGSRQLAPAVASASTRVRRRHPAGGWLHARQWLQNNEMHARHHLRQLRRLVQGA